MKPHTKFKAEGLYFDEGRRWTAYAVLHELPSAVLFPHHGRDGRCDLFRKARKWVMPGDNVTMDVELIVPIAMEEKAALCYSRRWSHGRRRGSLRRLLN